MPKPSELTSSSSSFDQSNSSSSSHLDVSSISPADRHSKKKVKENKRTKLNPNSNASPSSSFSSHIKTELNQVHLKNNSSLEKNNQNIKNVPTSTADVSNVVQGAGYLFLLQFLSKCCTVIFNQLILRHVDPNLFGLATIQAELLVSLILMLTREPIRLACLRPLPSTFDETLSESNESISTQPVESQPQAPFLSSSLHSIQLTNVSWLPPILGVGWAVLCGFCFYLRTPHPFFIAYSLGAWFDLCAEPYYALATYQHDLGIRSFSEGLALFVACFTQYYGIVILSKPILAFAVARILYGLTYFGTFFIYFWKRNQATSIQLKTFMYPIKANASMSASKSRPIYFDPELLKMAWSFLKQTLLKTFLTEGDKFLLSFWFTNYDQGIYALVFNYGSILVRMVFFPIEETARLLFPQLPTTNSLHAYTLTLILRLYILFMCFLGLGVVGLPTLIPLVLTSTWITPTFILACQWYLVYLPFLGINGILEAYLTVMATPQTLQWQNHWYFFCSFSFISISYILKSWGATALVLANLVNVLLRIAFGMGMSVKYYQLNLIEMFPKKSTLLMAFILNTMVIMSHSSYPWGWVPCTCVCLFSMLGLEYQYFKQLLELKRGKLGLSTKKKEITKKED